MGSEKNMLFVPSIFKYIHIQVLTHLSNHVLSCTEPSTFRAQAEAKIMGRDVQPGIP